MPDVKFSATIVQSYRKDNSHKISQSAKSKIVIRLNLLLELCVFMYSVHGTGNYIYIFQDFKSSYHVVHRWYVALYLSVSGRHL